MQMKAPGSKLQSPTLPEVIWQKKALKIGTTGKQRSQ